MGGTTVHAKFSNIGYPFIQVINRNLPGSRTCLLSWFYCMVCATGSSHYIITRKPINGLRCVQRMSDKGENN